MKVWIVTSGEWETGSDVVSVWSEREAAERSALSTDTRGGEWTEEWRDDNKTKWACGDSVLAVSAFELDHAADETIRSAR